MIAVRAEAVAHVVERRVDRVVAAVERQRQLDGVVVLEVAEREADQRDPLALDQRHRRRQQPARRGQDRLRVGGRLVQRVRAGRAREVVEAQAQHHRAADAAGAAQPAGRAGRRSRPGSRRGPPASCARAPAERPLRADRAPPLTGAHAPRVAVVRERVEVPARPPARASRRARPRRARPPGRTVVMPRSCSLAAVTRPTPQSRSTGSGCRNSSSPSGGTTSRPSGLATPLATLARNLVRATPTVIGSPTSLAHAARAAARRSRAGVPEIRSQPADVEERLVDRQPLDQRRRVVEDLEDRLARLRVGRPCAAARRSPAGRAGAPARPPIARPRPRGPWPRSSPRAPRPAPTITGRPRRRGSSRCSTDA